MQWLGVRAYATVELTLETALSTSSVSINNYCCRSVFTDPLPRNELHNPILLLWALPSNGCCLHSYHLPTGLYSTLYITYVIYTRRVCLGWYSRSWPKSCSSCYNGSLVTWTVIRLTAAKCQASREHMHSQHIRPHHNTETAKSARNNEISYDTTVHVNYTTPREEPHLQHTNKPIERCTASQHLILMLSYFLSQLYLNIFILIFYSILIFWAHHCDELLH
jgi:hypothetical protein